MSTIQPPTFTYSHSGRKSKDVCYKMYVRLVKCVPLNITRVYRLTHYYVMTLENNG